MVDLDGFEERRVTELSGGEQQRVALARALAPRPRLLMFDEPLGALDRTLKDEVLDELRAILHSTRIPAIYVTHDQEEAFTLADRILLLHDGRIVQSGAPAEIWRSPASVWAARFLDAGNLLRGTVQSVDGRMKVSTGMGEIQAGCARAHKQGDQVWLLLRSPSASSPRQPADTARLTASVQDVVFQREQFKVELEGGLSVFMPEAPRVGEQVTVLFDVECLDDE